MNFNIVKKDSWPIGMVIGITLPILFFCMLWLLNIMLFELLAIHLTEQYNYIYLLSFTANLFPIRHYLVKLKFEKTGLGILLATIAEVITYFYMYYQP